MPVTIICREPDCLGMRAEIQDQWGILCPCRERREKRWQELAERTKRKIKEALSDGS